MPVRNTLALLGELSKILREQQNAIVAREPSALKRFADQLNDLCAELTLVLRAQESREMRGCIPIAARDVQQLVRVNFAVLRRSWRFTRMLARWAADPAEPYFADSSCGQRTEPNFRAIQVSR